MKSNLRSFLKFNGDHHLMEKLKHLLVTHYIVLKWHGKTNEWITISEASELTQSLISACKKDEENQSSNTATAQRVKIEIHTKPLC